MRACPRAVTLIGFDTSMAVDGRVRDPADGRAGPHARRPTRSGCSAPPAHSAELLPALAELLERGGTGWDDVTAIAVGVGPGTFTGLRIGVATARGLAQALGVPLHPVSSLEALAAGIAAGAGAAPGDAVLPLIDARRGQVFAVALPSRASRSDASGGRSPCLPTTWIERIARRAATPVGGR